MYTDCHLKMSTPAKTKLYNFAAQQVLFLFFVMCSWPSYLAPNCASFRFSKRGGLYGDWLAHSTLTI